jgi:hypothetical protein
MWLFIHRPFEIWPVLGTTQIERVYIIINVVFGLKWHRREVRLTVSRQGLRSGRQKEEKSL